MGLDLHTPGDLLFDLVSVRQNLQVGLRLVFSALAFVQPHYLLQDRKDRFSVGHCLLECKRHWQKNFGRIAHLRRSRRYSLLGRSFLLLVCLVL